MKTSTKGIIGVLLSLLGVVAASPDIQGYVATFLSGAMSHHPVISLVVTTVGGILALVHQPVAPAAPASVAPVAK